MVKAMNPRKLQALETKKRIFECALELFKEHGFENMSVDSIVKMAGISKGAFYVHYESKLALIADFIKTIELDYENYFSSLSPDLKPSDLLILVTKKITDVISNSIGYEVMRVLYTSYLKKPIYTDPMLDYSRRIYSIYKQIIKMGIEQGEFNSSLDADLISEQCVISIRGMTYEWCIRFPNFNLTEESLRHLTLLLHGIKNSL